MHVFRLATIGFVTLLITSKWGDLPHADTSILQGYWEIVSVEREGKPDQGPVGFTLQFIADEVHFQVPRSGAASYATGEYGVVHVNPSYKRIPS